ncbi:MAG: COR domain-containing protein [Bacteroidota bacterium]
MEKNFIKEIPKKILQYNLTLRLESGMNDGSIYLEDNPLVTPPPEIIEQGNKAIRTYLENLEKKATPKTLNEVKVILVGEGASGKTSLVKRLLDQNFDAKEKQTHGIRITKKAFKIKRENLKVNFWDFGGQEIMHSTHQFFLTKRCVYVLVLDSRKDERAEYWLKYIESFGGNAPVLIVLNKIDENPSFDVNREFLNRKYPNISKYYKISCKSGKGVGVLKKDILNELWKLELRNTPFPGNWFLIKEHFQAMTEDYITYQEYEKVCIENDLIDEISQKILLGFLNDLGIVLNYEKLRWHNTQVLNPVWLTNSVYRIINSPIVADNKGKFDINDLDKIINDERYFENNPGEKKLDIPESQYFFIVAMMKEFELTYQINANNYIIPELLPTKQNVYKFKEGEAVLRFIVEYPEFLPTAIVPRLMVKLNKNIYKNQVWKTGMVLHEHLLFNSIANIVLDKESRKIIIEISGERRRDFLTVIRETIKEINNSYQKLEVVEWIPLPELHRGNEILVEYVELLGYEEEGVSTYYSGKLKKRFPVADLLNGVETPENRQPSPSCHIFISYARKDEKYKNELSKSLSTLVRLKKATLWDDSWIDGGADWEKEIFENLEKADIVLCLISADFIASEFCHEKELKAALKAHSENRKVVIPIRIRECLWDDLPISKLEGLPGKWMKKIRDDAAWTEIASGVEKVIKKTQSDKSADFPEKIKMGRL